MTKIEKPTYVSPKDSKKIFLINDDVRAMRGKYEETGKAELFKTFDQSIRIGDIVTVPSTTRHGITTVKIVDADVEFDFDNTEEAHWIISRVDPDEFLTLIRKEQDALHTIRRSELAQQRAKLRSAIFENQEEVLKTIDLANVGDATALPPTADKPAE